MWMFRAAVLAAIVTVAKCGNLNRVNVNYFGNSAEVSYYSYAGYYMVYGTPIDISNIASTNDCAAYAPNYNHYLFSYNSDTRDCLVFGGASVASSTTMCIAGGKTIAGEDINNAYDIDNGQFSNDNSDPLGCASLCEKSFSCAVASQSGSVCYLKAPTAASGWTFGAIYSYSPSGVGNSINE
ncbi:hypothetical protein HDU82_004632 [Entophlyctis luteolus]|nr:hypothetical protein HDU82_004632 [Entophlyctis luteolus]